MKAVLPSATTWLLLVMLTSCTGAPKPAEPPKLAATTAPTQAAQPTEVAIPTELAFSIPLVQLLSQSGLTILSVRSSKYMSLFQSSNKAAWIETDEGIVEAVFFADPAETEQIHITQQSNVTAGRYIYVIQAPPPILLQDRTIDAAFPLYYTVERGMFMETSSAELDKTLKRIFSER